MPRQVGGPRASDGWSEDAEGKNELMAAPKAGGGKVLTQSVSPHLPFLRTRFWQALVCQIRVLVH